MFRFDSVLSFLKQPKNAVAIVVIAVMLCGAALRLYDMPGAMLWSIDQARDYRMAAGVISEGMANLPLLGARAGGTNFHLGPIHNYFQIAGLSLTGIDEPYGVLLIEAILSIATIGLFFLLARGFFGPMVSLILTAHVAGGLIFVSLARFTWNPNVIPFFVTALLLAAWQLYLRQEHRLLVAALFALAAGVLMQLHAITFAIVPITLILWQWRLRLLRTAGEWAVASGVLVILFLPVLLSEYLTQFAVTKSFFATGAGRVDSLLDLSKAVFKMAYDIVWYHLVVLSSHDILPDIARLDSSKSLSALISRNLGLMAVIAAGMGAIISGWYFLWREIRASSHEVKAWWTMMGILSIVSLTIVTPLSLSSDPRYFHIVYFLPLFLYGWVLTRVLSWPVKKIAGVIATVLLGLSIVASAQWVNTTSRYDGHYDPDFELTVLEEYYRANMRQYQAMGDAIASAVRESGAMVVYGRVPAYEERALTVELWYRHAITMLPPSDEYYDPKGLYVVVRRTDKMLEDDSQPVETDGRFQVVKRVDFGTLVVFILAPSHVASLIPMTEEKRAELIRANAYTVYPCDSTSAARCRLRDILR